MYTCTDLANSGNTTNFAGFHRDRLTMSALCSQHADDFISWSPQAEVSLVPAIKTLVDYSTYQPSS